MVNVLNTGVRPMVELFEVCRNRGTVCPIDASVEEATRRLEESRAPILPVVDTEGRLVGVLTPELIENRELETPIHTLLPGSIPCCRTWDPVSAAIRTMRFHGLVQLPVVDAGSRIAGIVALEDLVERSES